MADQASLMAAEIAEIPAVSRRLLSLSGDPCAVLGARIKQLAPSFLVTVARGSSDHAASFFKYAVEILTGTPVASLGPSLASVYGAPLRFADSLVLAISQSGASPDLLAMVALAKERGRPVLAIVNEEASALAQQADWVLPMHAGAERSVAATKSFFASGQLALMLIAAWNEDRALSQVLTALPDACTRALDLEWRAFSDRLGGAQSLYICGRGPAFAIAQEMALKAKECCGLHAEAFSLAEVMHGPARLIGADFPVLVLLPDDRARQLSLEAIAKLRRMSRQVFVASNAAEADLALPATGHGMTDALLAVLPFYIMMERLARQMGLDPDRPPNLAKVTQTR
jgi:glutamine---fructose-6-phosphate transaminase (isomerizing)